MSVLRVIYCLVVMVYWVSLSLVISLALILLLLNLLWLLGLQGAISPLVPELVLIQGLSLFPIGSCSIYRRIILYTNLIAMLEILERLELV